MIDTQGLLLTAASVTRPPLTMSAVDDAMRPTYKDLAAQLLARDAADGAPHWVCLAGGPGSGKSTLSAAVVSLINEEAGTERAVVLPMDGFHYSRAELQQLEDENGLERDTYLKRRGSPWTFDAQLCYESLAAAKRAGEATLPTYSRVKSDPVPGGVELKTGHDIVIVEGNYLLMRHDPRWAPLDALWDERWFLRCRDPALQRRRLVLRHLETWSDEKAARWGAGEEGAAKRADANDVLNMELIAPCEEYAERVIDSMDSSES